jgi:hypothetical protein
MATIETFFDFSRPLSAKELRSFQARQKRLNGVFGTSAERSTATFNTHLGAPGNLQDGFRIRTLFSCLQSAIAEDEVSDRSAPRRELRPPATRIVTSQGAALRLYVTAIGAVQVGTKPGGRPLLALPLGGDSKTIGWDDVVATGAVPSGKGLTVSMTRDKKARSIRNALDTLCEAGLVHLLGEPGKRGRHDGFVLLNDAGWQVPGADPLPYTVPKNNEDFFTLPAGFVTNGWLNVLEDSEIAVLLMVGCGRFGLGLLRDNFDLEPGEVAIPGEARLRLYGIHRDPFSAARKTLEWFGLIRVREVARHHEDGRGEDGAMNLHRLNLRPEGFESNAFDVVRHVIGAQVERRTRSGN